MGSGDWVWSFIGLSAFRRGSSSSLRPRLHSFGILKDLDLTRKPDLANYNTYAWNKSQVPVENLANHLRIINAIQEQMKEHGFRIDTVNPEVRIRYELTLHERVEGTSSQNRSVWDNANSTVTIDFSREKRAEFGIDIMETETNFMLWQTKGNYPLGTPDRAPRQITEAVADLFSQFPVNK